MLAIRWEVLWGFFAMSGIMFWSILFFGGVLSIVVCIRRILHDKQYQEYISIKAEERLNEMQALSKRVPDVQE